MAKYSIIFNKLKILAKKDAVHYASEMMSHPYSEEDGWGYADVQRVDERVYAILQKRVSNYYRVWNDEIQQIERQCFQIVIEVPFEMDFQYGLLIAEGTNAQLNRVKQSFRQVFWNEFVYEEIQLKPVDYIHIFAKSHILISVDELTINDFQYEDSMIGRYTAKLTSQQDILSKIDKHSKNIIRAKLKINLNLNGDGTYLTVNNKNIVVLDSTDESKEAFIGYMKSNIK